MPVNVNRVVVGGNLTRDPELRRTQSGCALLDFCVACNDRRRNAQSGEWEDVANYVDCILFGKRAEAICEFLRKGSAVVVDGKLRYETWESDGRKRSRLRIVVNEIQFSGGKAKKEPEQEPQATAYDEDIPF